MLKPINLLCNDSIEPLGVDDLSPTFSWQTASDTVGGTQAAYQIRVIKADAPCDLLWDSGKVFSDTSVGICYSGLPLTERTAYIWQVRQWDNSGKVGNWSEPTRFETGLMGHFCGKWIGPLEDSKTWRLPDPLPAPMLRKSFFLNCKAKSARVYICGLGYHKLFVNGKNVSDTLLAPTVSQYNEKIYYETLDITDLLAEGENVFGVILGNGWYNSYTKDPWNFAEAPWRDRPKLWLEAYIGLENNESVAVISDHTWRFSTGPIIADGLRHGEVYDARLEKNGWSSPGYDDKDFFPVQIKRSPGGILGSRQITPIRKVETLKAVKIYRHGNGTCVYDFGKNISGYVRIHAKGYDGAQIVFRYSERIDENFNINREKISAYIYSGEFQTDRYTMRGNDLEEWTPSFTYHGFRYIEISGYPGEYNTENFTAEVIYTDFSAVGEFLCSDETVNKIYNSARLSTLTNFHGLPEDCPHREKNGWTGDAWSSAEQLLLNFDARRDYSKWLNDIRDCQRPDGHLPGCIPTADWGYRRTGIAWGAALVFIPWYQYIYCGDKKIIEENYSAAKKFVKNTAGFEIGGIVTHDGETPYAFGDWMPPGGNAARKCSVAFMETATYYMMLVILSKMASVLGQLTDEEFYTKEASRIKNCFGKRFINGTSLTVTECITAYGCIVFNGLDESGCFLKALAEEIKKNGGIADFGFHGMKYVLGALIDNDLQEIAYKMLVNPKYPGWRYMIDNGATTLWETWDGKLSQNHHAFSDIVTFLYKALGGICVDPEFPGFKHFFLKPYMPEDMDFVTAYHISPYGKIESSWKRQKGDITYKCTIPVNTEATIIFPNGIKKKLCSGTYQFSLN